MSKLLKWVACGDNHGDRHDPEAVDALLEFCKKENFAPDFRIHLGDCFDLRSLRSQAKDKEANESLKEDLDEGVKFLRKFSPDVWLWGNHEARLDHTIASSGDAKEVDYCQSIKDQLMREARKIGCTKVLPYHADLGVFELGKIAFAHGYSHSTRAVQEQGAHYATRGGGFVCGHIHRLEMVALRKWGGGAAYSAGCLCDKNAMTYASHRLGSAMWGSGFSCGWTDGQDWKVMLVHKVGRRWVFPTNLKLYDPK